MAVMDALEGAGSVSVYLHAVPPETCEHVLNQLVDRGFKLSEYPPNRGERGAKLGSVSVVMWPPA